MAKIVTPENFKLELNSVIKDFSDKTKAKINKGIRNSLVLTWGDIIEQTPVDKGGARGGWIVADSPSKERGRKSKVKGRSYVRKQTAKLDLLKQRMVLFSNIPYIRMLEYGGYSTKNSDKPSSKVTSKGYSKQAPKGMVRRNVMKWKSNLRKSLQAL